MSIGVFDGTRLLAECVDHDAADEYRSELLELELPEQFRRSLYNDSDLITAEVPEDYGVWDRLLRGLRRSRQEDRTIVDAIRLLRLAQWERSVIRNVGTS